jgi:hypothetical protein
VTGLQFTYLKYILGTDYSVQTDIHALRKLFYSLEVLRVEETLPRDYEVSFEEISVWRLLYLHAAKNSNFQIYFIAEEYTDSSLTGSFKQSNFIIITLVYLSLANISNRISSTHGNDLTWKHGYL